MFRILGQDKVPSGFTAQLAHYPWIDSAWLNDSAQKMELNTVVFHERTGNAFMYVKADAALIAGNIVYKTLPATETALSAGSTVALQALSSAGLTVNAEIGNWLYLENGGASPGPTIVPVKENAASTITFSKRDTNSTLDQYDADVLSTTITNSTNAAIVRPGHVSVGTASAVPVGVALATVTQYYYTFVQVGGLVLVLGLGNTTALASGVPAICQASGYIKGTPTQTAAALVTLYNAAASIVPLFAYTGSSAELIPCNVNFFGNL